jgi:hypothetical protein
MTKLLKIDRRNASATPWLKYDRRAAVKKTKERNELQSRRVDLALNIAIAAAAILFIASIIYNLINN